MTKKIFSLLGGMLIAGTALAQPCATDQMNHAYKAQHPGIALKEAQIEADIQAQLSKMDLSRFANKGTDASDSVNIDIPVVVHIIHDYNTEYVTDNSIYTMITELNQLYNKGNDLSTVIRPFVPLIGNGHLRFHLATVDPQGNPSHGITRRRSYLTVGGDDQAKFDLWNPSAYLNIWVINRIGLGATTGIVAAYSMVPASASFVPHYDGLITNYQFINNGASSSNTVGHEIGHYLNLSHPWGSNNNPGVACGDDGVPDTPPTEGHFGGCDLYDTKCAVGNPNGPDTTNVQNVMDYANCSIMFTQGQVDRMRAALRSNVAGRNNLWTAANLAATGALAPRPSLPPVADFSASRVFYCANSSIISFSFTNRSWNDTITSSSWTFSNGATNPTSTATGSLANGFSEPGWVTVSLTATSAHGTNTVTKQAVYAADMNSISGNFTEEFTPGNATSGKFPAFDYYNTGRKWQITNTAGYSDQYSMQYTNQDNRTGAAANTGTPKGDYSDFFTPGFDLSTFSSICNLNFLTAGAYRAGSNQNDKLQISYSTTCGASWTPLDSVSGSDLGNNGTITSDFTPSNAGQWKLRGFNVPAAARTSRTFFRFRYLPGTNNAGQGTGNHFYIDRLGINSFPTEVNSITLENTGMEVAPNPTSGAAFVVLKGAGNVTATLLVTDITGKTVYQTEKSVSGDVSRIDIPASNIIAKGIYLVRVAAGSKSYTRKLVVN